MGDIRRRQGFGRAVGAFTLGAAAGSVLALLYAPASGQMTRRRIGMRVKALEHVAGRRVQQAQRVLARRVRRLRSVAAGRVGDTREWLAEHLAAGNGRHPATQHRTARAA